MCRAVAVVSVSAEDEDEDASSDEDEVQHADGVLTRPASQEGRRVLAKEPPSFRNGQSCVAKACLAVANAPLELTRANLYLSGSFKILLILQQSGTRFDLRGGRDRCELAFEMILGAEATQPKPGSR